MKMMKKLIIIPAIVFVIVVALLTYALFFGNSYSLKTGKSANFSVQLNSKKEKKITLNLKDADSIVFSKMNNTKVSGDFLFIIKNNSNNIVRKGLIHKDGDTTIKELDKGKYTLLITYTGKKKFNLKGKIGLQKIEKQKYATLAYGSYIHKKIEEFTGDYFNYFSHSGNDTITTIKLAKEIDDKYKKDEYLVSDEKSIKPIYMWIEDNKTIYFYSESPIEFNQDASYTFYGLKSLIDIKDLKYFSTNDVKKMEYLFRDCTSLSDISAVSYWDTSKVENMGGLFSECSSLMNINPLLALNTSLVTKISQLIGGTNVTDISVLKYFDTSKVESILGIFSDTKIMDFSPISNWDVSNVKSMSYAFSSTKIKKIEGLEKWDVSNVDDMNNIFSYCDYLEDISGLKNWKPVKLTNLRGAFQYTAIKNADALKNWDLTNIRNIKEIFYDCRKLISVDGLSNWDTSKLTDMSRAFAYTSFKDTKAFTNWNVSKVESLSETFSHTKINNTDGFKKWDTSSVEEFDETFKYSNIKDLEGLAKWDVSKGTDFTSMFEGCKDLKDTSAINSWKFPMSSTYNHMFKKIGGDLPTWAK